MLWFVTEIFVGAYNVVSLGSAEEAFEAVGHPVTGFDYFGCNDARYGWNVVCQKTKSDKLLSRIPLILLSALNNIDEQTRGTESGAEAYITKPFNGEYLEKVVRKAVTA